MALGSRAHPALLALVGVALAAGAGAALLTGVTPQPAPTAGPAPVVLPNWVWGILFLSPLVVGFVGFILQRGRSKNKKRNALGILGPAAGVFLFLLLFILASHYIGSGGCFVYCYGSTTTAANNTTVGHNNSTPPPPGTTSVAPPLSLSNVLPIFIVIAVAFVAAAVAIPVLLSRSARRRGEGVLEIDRARDARAALSAAVSELDEGRDPRRVIVRLYDRLLSRVSPLGVGVEFSTAEEIRANQLLPLGVRRPAADTLTRLFEEARYSTHPMGADAVGLARDAIRAAEADLTRFEAAP